MLSSMASREAIVFGLIVVAVAASHARRPRRPRFIVKRIQRQTSPTVNPATPVTVAATDNPGLAITEDRVTVLSWDRWMAQAPQAITAAMQESDKPEEIATNVFRRLYPNVAWPPAEGTPLWEQWQTIVAAVGRTLERPFKTHMHVVS